MPTPSLIEPLSINNNVCFAELCFWRRPTTCGLDGVEDGYQGAQGIIWMWEATLRSGNWVKNTLKPCPVAEGGTFKAGLFLKIILIFKI